MTTPEGTDVTTLVQAVVSEARRLGLIWDLRPAEISTVDGTTITAIYDGDTVPIPVINMASWVPAVGARVMVMAVPPAGNYIIGSATPAASVRSNVVDSFTTTSTAYTTAGTPTPPACGVVFVVPPSGLVEVSFKAQLVNNSAGQFTIVGFEVVTGPTIGSGTLVLAASDDNCLANQSTSQFQFGISVQLPPLTPGGTYNAQLGHRVTGGTGTILRREIHVSPA